MSCFGGEDERIYAIEVLIEKLTLTPEKMKDIREIGDSRLVVKVKLLDFPAFEITREDFHFVKSPPPDKDGSLNFLIGRSCLFVKRPKDLVRELKAVPMKVGVFRVGDTYPSAETEIPLPGCLCDQVAMASNDRENIPKPFTVKGGFHLTDPGENPAGSLDMEFKLTCFGRNITTHYGMRDDSFVFRNEDKEREFSVKRLIPLEYRADEPAKVMQTGEDIAEETKPKTKGKKKKKKKKKGGAKGKVKRKKR